MGQVKAPRYQSPIEAPVPQPIALPAPTAITPNGTVVEDVIVRVNDQVINRSDVERSQRQLLEEARAENLSADDLAQRQKDLLRDMIDQQLLLSRGKELDINVDAELIRQLDAIRKQNKLDSMEALQKAVREYRPEISYEDFKGESPERQILSRSRWCGMRLAGTFGRLPKASRPTTRRTSRTLSRRSRCG